MPGIFFTNVWMLAGLLALSVPVIIHLLLKRKTKRARFSTVQFFLRQDEQASQRRKLRNWFLLALRLLICALLVLAFARPYLRNSAGAGAQQRRTVLILLDRSLSMQASATDGPKWVRARESARHILAELKPGDRAALVSCGPRAEVLSEWAPPVAVSKALSELSPTDGAANLGEGLQLARKLLSVAHADAGATLYVITDLQRSGCQNLASYPVPEQVTVKLIPVGDLVTPNLAVMDLQVKANQEAEPHAVVASFSDEDTPDAKLQFAVDGQVVSSLPLALAAGASTNLDLNLPRLKPGWHDVTVQAAVNDALTADNTRYQTLFVPEPAQVLVVEPRLGQRSFEQESFFVTTALDPDKDSTNGAPSRFAFETLSADDLAVRLTGNNGGRPACDLVVLPGLKQLPSALGPALIRYVQGGGGLWLFLGDGVSANHYNAELRGLLPTPLGGVEVCPNLPFGWRIGEYNTNVAIFAAFDRPNSGDLSLPRFLNRFALTNREPNSVAARFEDGTPLVVTGALGRGRVVLVNTSADTAWNDWPKHKTFVPWVHGTAEYLTGTAVTPPEAQVNLVAGMAADLDLGDRAAKARFVLHTPDGKDVNMAADDQGQLRDLPVSKPGIYSVRDASGREIRRVAVNVPPQESDLAALSPNDFTQQLARVSEGQTTLAAGLFGSNGNHRELWRVLLLAVAGLLLVELFLANRTLA
jgi:Aerotolerance regulator N-terminal/von Willebrand factor type A domain